VVSGQTQSQHLLGDTRPQIPSRHVTYHPSSQGPASNQPSGSLSPSSQANAVGLCVLHQPQSEAPVDIVFVHGLGGDSRKTWSKNHDPNLFWPGLWLPREPVIGKSRILSFGYNANFRPGALRSIANVGDFAKELLFEMKFGTDSHGKDLCMGRVPIIFIVHSMGGLIAKKACILGQNDGEYQAIARSISAIMFLATPHRGTSLAELLNRVLAVSFQSPRNFINDLNEDSRALEELNEQFRHVAPRLSIVSFYETLATAIGPKKVMVLKKDSSILGYPVEISCALDADHHGVCKYSNSNDPNYVSVRNMLKFLVDRFQSKGLVTLNTLRSREAKTIGHMLGVYSAPEDDLNSFRRWWMPGTCDWLLQEPAIRSWLEVSQESRILWLSAPPGTGKSILATHVIKNLLDSGLWCQYYFFKFGDQTKRSSGDLLRSLAFQIAKKVPTFSQTLLQLSEEHLRLEKTESITIWQKLFESVLFKLDIIKPLFWVIDALDESESSKEILDLLRNISNSRCSIRILIISRQTESISLAFARLSNAVPFTCVELGGHDHNANDILKYLESETAAMRGSPEVKVRVIQIVRDRAVGNFLWVRLVLEEILHCHSEEAIQECLYDMPNDMSKMYERIEQGILSNPRKSNRLLAKRILQWVICASRALTLSELGQALSLEFPEFLDLRKTVQDICGQFVLIDQNEHVGMVHQTARDYLITSSSEVAVDIEESHTQLLTKTVSTLLDPKLRAKITENQYNHRNTDPFILYSAASWPYHLRHVGPASDAALSSLARLFRSTAVLTWIQSLALVCQLEILVESAKALATFVTKIRRHHPQKPASMHRPSDLELLDQWNIDLVKIVGRFSMHLAADPSAIYELVPPFCPETSAVYKQFYKSESAKVGIAGISNSSWTDILGKIMIPNGQSAGEVVCTGQHIAVLAFDGTVFVWNSSNFVEVCRLHHCEPVTTICFNDKGNRLVSYGLRSTKLWSLPTAQLLSTTPNPPRIKALAIVFVEKDKSILAGCDDNKLRRTFVDNFSDGWHVFNMDFLKGAPLVDGAAVGPRSPICLAFNGDATQIGVSYLGSPLLVWDIEAERCIGLCKRAKVFGSKKVRASENWFAVERFTWNPISGHIIGIFMDGCIFKWHPVTEENQENRCHAVDIAASANGNLFATSDASGLIRVWDFANFNVIYQLSSDRTGTSLGFSPDCRRLYDLRGSFLNVWEPDNLIRFSQTTKLSSDSTKEGQTHEFVPQVPEVSAQFDAVSALASTRNHLYCVGTGEGAVRFFDSQNGKGPELLLFPKYQCIEYLTWANDGMHVAISDPFGNIMVRRVSKEISTSLMDVKEYPPPVNLKERGIDQLVFNHDSTLLLVISYVLGQIISVDTGAQRCSASLSSGPTRKWLNHPTRNDLFLGFGVCDIKVFRWKDFSKLPCLEFVQGQPRLDSQMSPDSNDVEIETFDTGLSSTHLSSDVRKAIVTQDGEHVLVQIGIYSGWRETSKQLLIFKYSTLDAAASSDFAGPVTSIYIPPQVVAAAKTPLGVLNDMKLAFLDQDLWFCTFKLGSEYDGEALKRHYFIPRDWLSFQSLEMCCLMPDGTLLVPKDDEVAVIKFTGSF